MSDVSSTDNAHEIKLLRRFAYLLAGPRDFVINLAINGAIAWYLFGDRTSVPLAGPGSIFTMLLPMAFIESTLTTFFGLLNGAIRRRKLRSSSVMAATTARKKEWLVAAARQSLFYGVIGLAMAIIVQFVVRLAFPSVMLAPRTVILVIGLSSGLLAYCFHVRAVLASTKI